MTAQSVLTVPAGVQALVFDFDGTILDTETTEFQHWQALYREHQRELALTDWQRGVGTWDAFDPWAGLPEAVRGDRDAVAARLHTGLMQAIAEQDVRPGVRTVLEGVAGAGLRLALATSSSRDWVTRWLSQHGLLDLFEVLATRDDVARVKPDPELYLLAARQLKLPPESCVAVEDSLNGATAAAAAGLRVVVVPNDVTRTQAFDPAWGRLEGGYVGGLAGLLAAVGK